MVLVLVVACTVGASCRKQAPPPQSSGIAPTAQRLVELLAKGDFTAAVADFDATMQQALPAPKLGETWRSVGAQFGAFKRQAGVRTATEQGFEVAYVTCEFERSKADVKVVFDRAGKIGGLWFLPAQPPAGS